MNLQSEIAPELWSAVGKSYESGVYTSAILEAIHYLTDILRERAGVDGDGYKLVGQALGGNSPRLRINKFQTETEKGEQKGFEDLLRGFYQAIRNPRSHEQMIDSQQNADSLILFINYVVNVINKAKPSFVVDEWVDRVFDPYFVKSKLYAESLVEEIPASKRYETLITLYWRRNLTAIDALRCIYPSLYSVLEEPLMNEFLKVVSNELKTTTSNADITYVLTILQPEHWAGLDKVAKMRIEALLYKEINLGTYTWMPYDEHDISEGRYECTNGALGTWCRKFIPYFLSKNQLSSMLLDKMSPRKSIESRNYVAQFFLLLLPNIVEEDKIRRFCRIISEVLSVSTKNDLFTKMVMENFYRFPSLWKETIKEFLRKESELKYNELFSEDEDIPF